VDDFDVRNFINQAGKVPHEPSADAKAAGGNMYEMYTGLVTAGFTEEQALKLIALIISITITGMMGGDV
jgi:hypothetical protein